MERIYGIKQGGDKTKTNNVQFATQEDLANQLGISVRTLQNAKTLTNLPKEIQDLVENGSISPSTAARLVAKLSPKQAKNRQRQIHTVIKSVTPTEYNNSNKEI